MSYKRLGLAVAACAVGLVVLAGALAQPVPLPERINTPKKTKKPANPTAPVALVHAAPNEITQTFPSNDVMQRAWKAHGAPRKANVLSLQGAWFKRSPSDDWIKILGAARLAEAFVPYHSGSPRFWDV